MNKVEFNKLDFMAKVEFLQSGISATMCWSYKYGMLIPSNKMVFIEEEEKEYIDNHNEEVK